MEKLQLFILTKKDLEKRYNNLNTIAAHLTNEAISKGYSIAALHYEGLNKDAPHNWLENAHNEIASYFKGQSYKIGMFTDLSSVNNDVVFFSFKTKDGLQIAHSFTGCDSDEFIYT